MCELGASFSEIRWDDRGATQRVMEESDCRMLEACRPSAQHLDEPMSDVGGPRIASLRSAALLSLQCKFVRYSLSGRWRKRNMRWSLHLAHRCSSVAEDARCAAHSLTAVTSGIPNSRAQATVAAIWTAIVLVASVHQPLAGATRTSGEPSADCRTGHTNSCS